MKLIQKSRILCFGFLLLFIVLIQNCSVPTNVRLHDEFVHPSGEIERISVLPADAQVTYLVFNGDNRRLPEEETLVVEASVDATSAIIKQRGYEPVASQITDIMAENSDLKFEYQEIIQSLQSCQKLLYSQNKITMKNCNSVTASVGPEINLISSIDSTDAVLFLNYKGFKKSDGLLAKQAAGSILLGVLSGTYYIPTSKGGQAAATLVHGTTGDVLWSNIFGAGEQEYDYIIEKVYNALPNYKEDLAYYIEKGKVINHNALKKENAPNVSGTKLDTAGTSSCIYLKDERIFCGDILDVEKKSVILGSFGTLYIINVDKIDYIAKNGQKCTDAVLKKKYSYYNCDDYSEEIRIE